MCRCECKISRNDTGGRETYRTAITAVTAVTAVTAGAAPAATSDGVTTLITAIMAPITAGTAVTALARRADVRTPERRRLLVPHCRSRASEALGHAAGLARGAGGGNCDGVSRRGGSFHHPI